MLGDNIKRNSREQSHVDFLSFGDYKLVGNVLHKLSNSYCCYDSLKNWGVQKMGTYIKENAYSAYVSARIYMHVHTCVPRLVDGKMKLKN